MNRSRTMTWAASAVVAMLGCSPSDDDDAADSGGTSGVETGAETMDPTGPPTSGDPSGTTSGDGDTTDDTDDAEETGEVGDGAAVDACEAACVTQAPCEAEWEEDVDEREALQACLEDCGWYEGATVACDEAGATLQMCLGGLSCEELEDYWDEISDPYPCQAEEEAEIEACPE